MVEYQMSFSFEKDRFLCDNSYEHPKNPIWFHVLYLL